MPCDAIPRAFFTGISLEDMRHRLYHFSEFEFEFITIISVNIESWQCHICFSVNDQAFSFAFFGLAQDRAMSRHAKQIRGMLANLAYTRNATGRNADPRGAGTQYQLCTALSQSIQARILPLRSIFVPDTALVFSTKCKNI
jgi:hypothetical protein